MGIGDMNRNQFIQLLGIVCLLVWSAILLAFYGSGRIEAYIRPEYLRTCSLLAGLGLGALGVFNLFQLRTVRQEGACYGHHHQGDKHDGSHLHGHGEEPKDDPGAGPHLHHDHGLHDDHDHDHEDQTIGGNVAMALVLIAPILAAAAYSQDQFVSAQTIRNKGFADDPSAVQYRVTKELDRKSGAGSAAVEDEWEYTIEDLERVVDRSSEGYLMLTVDQLFYTSGDEDLQRVLDGEGVVVTGQVLPEDGLNPGGKRKRLFTLMVTCCAADAQPISIPIEFESVAPQLSEMSWVRVMGTMRYPVEEGRTVAVLEVEKIEPTEEPYSDMIF